MPAYAGRYFWYQRYRHDPFGSGHWGLNPLVKDLLKRAAGRICGMVEMGEGLTSLFRTAQKKDLIALTEFKFSEECCSHIRHLLKERV